MPTKKPSRFLQFLSTTLTCSTILLTTIAIGLAVTQQYHSFLFSISLYIFIPIWLWCYGLLLHSHFRYWPMASGVFLSIALIAFFTLVDINPLTTRLQLSLALATTGTTITSTGAWLHWFTTLFKSNRPSPDHHVST